jgi:glycosyltransferase involved in cell wall biosynthesis
MGGAQLYLHELVKKVTSKHRSEVACFFDDNRTSWLLGTTLRAPEEDKFYEYEGVMVRRLSFTKKEKKEMFPWVISYYFNKPGGIAKISSFIEKKLNKEQYCDLIHNVRVGREPLSYASYNLARQLKIPFVFTPLHHPRWGHWFYREYQELYRKADGLFALTPYEKELYKKLGVDDHKIFITGTGPVICEHANPEGFKKKYNLNGYTVLFIGQGYKYKGIVNLLKAAEIVFNHIKNVNFIFIGPHTKYSYGLFKKNKDTRIIHLGKVDLQTKTDALAACDLLCLPSEQESFGAVFLEAWCFEKPVIGLDIPQLRCLIKDSKNGYLVLPDARIIADKIIVLLNNADLREKLGKNGKNDIVKNFTWDAIHEKTLQAYEEILNNFKNSEHGKQY